MKIENNPDYERFTVREFNEGELMSTSDDARIVDLIEGQAMSFGAGVEALGQGSADILFQWQIEPAIEEGFKDITASDVRFSGADTAKLLLPNATADLHGATLRCLVARVGSSIRSSTRAIQLKVKPSVQGGDITPVAESVQDWANRKREEQRRKQLRNYGR